MTAQEMRESPCFNPQARLVPPGTVGPALAQDVPPLAHRILVNLGPAIKRTNRSMGIENVPDQPLRFVGEQPGISTRLRIVACPPHSVLSSRLISSRVSARSQASRDAAHELWKTSKGRLLPVSLSGKLRGRVRPNFQGDCKTGDSWVESTTRQDSPGRRRQKQSKFR